MPLQANCLSHKSNNMIREEEILHIGQLVRAHGHEGTLQCRMLNTCWEDNDPTFIILCIDAIYVPFRVDDWRTKGATDVLLTLHGIDSTQQADKLIGCEAYMLRRDLPNGEMPETELTSLTGYKLHDHLHGDIGTIRAIDSSTLNTLVELDNGLLLPLHEDLIERIDTNEHTLYTCFPQGLIPD